MYIDPLTQIDFYKAGHRQQYPAGTNKIYSNLTARSSARTNLIKGMFDDKVVFFGLQYFVKDFLINTWNENFFKKPKAEVVAKYKRRLDNSLGKDAVPVDHIEALHDLGYLPILIKAVPEGTRVPIKTPVLTITNTHPEFFWLVNYLETVMSNMLWKASTSATTAYEYKKILTKFAKETGAPLDFIQFQAHDFSFRGMSGIVDACLSSAAHMTSFVGTDTVSGIDLLEEFYNADSDKELVGCSVPATEHSVMCMGTQEDEVETFRRLINETYPKGIVSIVSDTWDFWQVITEYTKELQSDIMKRDGRVVLRPDSGDPVKIICGQKYTEVEDLEDHSLLYLSTDIVKCDGKYYSVESYDDGWKTVFNLTEVSEAEVKGAVECLWDIFGGTKTSSGYKMLDQHIGLIYGDSITPQRCYDILQQLKDKGFASNNIVFGVGSYTYQHVTRDTYGFAVKSTYGEVNGIGREIFKDPKTDDGTKKSARGLITVNEDLTYSDRQTEDEAEGGILVPVFQDSKLLVDQSLQQIRDRLK